jgi:hypothetical protein
MIRLVSMYNPTHIARDVAPFSCGVSMNTRQEISNQSWRISSAEVSQFSLGAVGAAATLSAMAAYWHFKDKENLDRTVGGSCLVSESDSRES